MLAGLFNQDAFDGNRNKVYAKHVVNTGSPIYFPQRKKVKGWQRNSKGKVMKNR
jgi:hypothetical protein